MVQVIERRELAKGQQTVEVHIYPLPRSPDVIVAKTIYGEPLGYGHRWHMSPLDIPVAEAFLGAIRLAEERGIPFVWINDPHRLFPPDKRPSLPPGAAQPDLSPSREESLATTTPSRRLRSKPMSQSGGVPFMITSAQKRRLSELGYGEEQIRNMSPAEAHKILNLDA